jgi:hypothetical protein
VLTLEEATRAIDELSARVRRLEQRLDAVEPETMRGVYDPLAQREPRGVRFSGALKAAGGRSTNGKDEKDQNGNRARRVDR